MRAVVEPSDVVDVTVRPGVSTVRFLMSVTPASFSCCADTAKTEIGTSCTFWLRFCAVTMTSSSVAGPPASAALTAPLDSAADTASSAASGARDEPICCS